MHLFILDLTARPGRNLQGERTVVVFYRSGQSVGIHKNTSFFNFRFANFGKERKMYTITENVQLRNLDTHH